MKKIDKIIKNTILGGNMKKILFLAFLMSLSSLAFAATLDINSIGLHGSDGPNDFVVAAGETVTCIIDYSQTDCGIDNVYANGTSNYRIMVYYYNDDPPTDANYDTGRYVTSSDISNINDDTGNHLYSFTFLMPSVTSTSMQVRLGLAGSDTGGFKSDTYSDEYMSYVARGSITVPTGSQPSGCRGYLSFDSTTETPTLTNPAADSKDNESIHINMGLPEDAKTGTVKLRIETDSSGSPSGTEFNTLTLIADHENIGTDDFYINGADLNDDTQAGDSVDDVASVSTSNTSFTEGTVYHWRLDYQDAAGNPVASSSFHKFTYDTSVDAINIDSATDGTGDDITVQFDLPEDAASGGITVYIKDTSNAQVSYFTLNNTTPETVGNNKTFTIQGDALSNTDYFGSYVGSGNASQLTDGTTYRISMVYEDKAGNTATESGYVSVAYAYDQSTESPTMSSASELADANGPLLRVSYSLPEAGTNETVKILVCNTNSSSDIHNTITLEGHNSSGASGNIDLDLPFATTDSDVYAVSTTTTLTNGTTYYTFVQYQDAAGNTAATSSASKSFTWDGATQTPTLTLPENNGSDNASLTVNVTYPETEYSGTLKLYISDHTAKKIGKTRNSSRASMILTLTGITSGSDFVLDGSDLSAGNNTNISATSGLFSLEDGNQYDVYFGYQDSYGNSEATSGTNTFTYDTSASTISISSPANNTTVTGNFDLVYTKSEVATNGTFKIMFDNSTDGNDATLTMNDTYCGYTTEKTLTVNVGTLSNTTGVSNVSGATHLVDGQSYTVRFNYTDEAGNVATESTINITYSSTTTTLTISKVAVDAGNPLDGNQAWQPVMCYKAETNTNTSTISSFKITKLGSNADTDFETDAVTLFESDDATLDTGSDTNLGAKAFATNWTWNSGFHSVGSGTDDKYYFFCVDVKSGFNETHTIGSRVGDGDVASNADQTVNDPSGNLDSESKYLDGYTSIAGGDYGDASITPGTNDNPFFTFHIKSNQGSTTMSQVVIALSGSVVSGDFPTGAFQLYKDTDSNFDGATAIGSSLDFGSTLTFSSLGQTITTTDTYYFLTCDVSSGADDTHNIKATLTASDSNPTTGYANILDADAGDISGGTHTLPVELSSFNITNTGRKVILAWTTQTETENQGFNIFRGISENDIENSQAMKLNKLLIPGAINSTQPTDYMFYDDKRIEYGTTYFYWIQTVDLGGYTEFSDPVSYKPLAPTDSHDIPGLLTYGLHTNYPNPFNPETTISFVLDKSSEVTLDIYNIKGQKIKSLYHDNATSGKLYKIVWNGKNDQNRNVASGVYFYRLKTAYSQYQKSMLLLK